MAKPINPSGEQRIEVLHLKRITKDSHRNQKKAMKNIKTLERLQQIHSLIATENTGTPKELSHHMQISERSVHSLIDQLKDYNAIISYCRGRKTYYYEDPFELEVSISVSVLTNNEVTHIFGGSYFIKNKCFVARNLQ